jgi:lysine 6-dehydrogenase
MAFRYEGKIPSMEYKTLRYPGHATIMEAIRDLGLLDQEAVEVRGVRVAPRDLALAVMGPRLTKKKGKDVVALRVTVRGTREGRRKQLGWELVDWYDDEHGISAMMRTTGYSLSIIGQMQARGDIPLKGVQTPDEAVPGERYIEELGKRGVNITPIRDEQFEIL